MNKLFVSFLILFASTSYAEEYETGGGYDAKAAEKLELEAKSQQEKIYKANAIAEKKRQSIIAAAKNYEKQRKELLPENMARLKEHEVCMKAGQNRKSDKFSFWISELKRRKTLFDAESIKNREIKIHGYECDIFAAYGKPHKYNRTVNAYGTSVQFVYNRMYIYTEDGIITSWSD